MHGQVAPVSIPIARRNRLAWSATRAAEPITFGIPLPAGVVSSVESVGAESATGRALDVQVRALDTWPDGSVRWALIDVQGDSDHDAGGFQVTLGAPRRATSGPALRVSTSGGGVRVDTGLGVFEVSAGGPFPFSRVEVAGREPIDAARSGLAVNEGGRTHEYRVSGVDVLEAGPVRAELAVRAVAHGEPTGSPVEVFARLELFAGSATARLGITLRNPRRAHHAGGHWPLGDPGSVDLASAILRLALAGEAVVVRCAAEHGQGLEEMRLPFELHQESSGGERWNGPAHRDRHGRVPLRFRGYRLRSGDALREGLRASPIVAVEQGETHLAVAMPQCWENAPRAIRVEADRIEVGLFPAQHGAPFELQGGEQKTHEVVVAFARDAVSDPPLAWVHDPQIAGPPPEWCCDTGAVPFLRPASEDAPAYRDLVVPALDPEHGFFAKREAADEYGWRHFGDVPADHESAFQPDGRTLVSHYNNQYDVLLAFGTWFLRTGDVRWFRLMRDLARHVVDVDIYHTTEDKAAYGGGMFWHTYHYVDAGTATHRTYPPGGGASGGPSAEHNYNAGLMLHWFLTGDRASRDAAVDLGWWVVRMDDGRRTPFRWLAGGPTGLASASGSMDYHGPGRGGGNSILACLIARRLSGNRRFDDKAAELIRRCIHPADDIDARQLLDAERRWFYTVFLQALGDYLFDKAERRELDATFAHAHASLLHYARWMAAHERLYLDHPEGLEHPTETWAAQELRKADVFLWAAWFSAGDDRARFLERAWFFRDAALTTLAGMPTRRFTRPLVLALRHVRMTWFERQAGRELPEPPRPPAPDTAPPVRFTPQRAAAARRALWLAAALLVAVAGLAAAW